MYVTYCVHLINNVNFATCFGYK